MSEDIWADVEAGPSQTGPDIWGDAEAGRMLSTSAAPPVKFNASLFKKRTGRDPTPAELSMFSSNKGEGFPGFNPREKDPQAGRFTVGQAAVGAGEDALSMVTGGAAAIPAAVTYAVSPYSKNLENARSVQSALTYQPRTEAGKAGLKGISEVAGAPGSVATYAANKIDPSGQLSAALSDVGERTAIASPLLAEGVAALKGGGITRAAINKMSSSDFGSGAAEPAVEEGGVHPLQSIADSERQKLAQVDERLSQAGISLPTDREISPIVRASNNVAAKDLNLPVDAPMTKGMIEAGIKKNALPAYAEARKIAPWEASPAYESEASGINLKLIDEDIRPPPSGELSGPETVRLSQNLRNRASAYYRASETNPAFRPIAAAHDAAAEAIENEFERHVEDVPGLSSSWDQARTYIAKAKNVEAALDGGGNVRPTMLKSQMLKGKPLSGGIQDLAIAAAKYPDYFKATPAMPQSVGMARRVAAKFAPPIATAGGAAIGGAVGFPTTGAVLGGEAGAKLSSLLNPQR